MTDVIARAETAARRLYDAAARAAHKHATTAYDDTLTAAARARAALASAASAVAEYERREVATAADVYKYTFRAMRHLTEAVTATHEAYHHIDTYPRVAELAGRALAATAKALQ